MRIPRVYTALPLQINTEVTLTDQQAHYLSKVLRMESGRECILFNGNGSHFESVIVSIAKKAVVCAVKQERYNATESPLSTELAIGISRGERMDWVFQKATELGVTKITPLFTARGEVKLKGERLEKKKAHWQQVIISACEQSTRDALPILNAPITLDEYLSQADAEQKFVLHHRTEQTLSAISPPKSVSILIGPEGGLDEHEITQATHKQFQPLAMGPRVLRTETAPIAALSVMQHLWGDM